VGQPLLSEVTLRAARAVQSTESLDEGFITKVTIGPRLSALLLFNRPVGMKVTLPLRALGELGREGITRHLETRSVSFYLGAVIECVVWSLEAWHAAQSHLPGIRPMWLDKCNSFSLLSLVLFSLDPAISLNLLPTLLR
jgi:hypothetical protein